MCDPVTAVSIGTTLISGGLKAKGEFDQSRFNAATATQNRDLANLSAADARERGAADEQRLRLEAGRLAGTQRATLAANGVDLDSATSQQALADTRLMADLDAATIRNNAAREAWGYEVQAGQHGAAARMAIRQGNLAMAGTFLGTLGNSASAYAGRR